MAVFAGTNDDDILPPPGGDNSGDDTLSGIGGNDILYGGGGIDVLNGGTGTDTMSGGAGNDKYHVDNANDVVTEAANEGIDKVYSTVTFTLPQHVEELYLRGEGSLVWGTGNDDANRIVGNSKNNRLFGLGGDDVLDGGEGGDRMMGGTGNDTYYFDDPDDVVDETGGDGIDKVITLIGFNLKATLGLEVENVTLIGGNNVKVKGNDLDNVVLGNFGANLLNGGSGDDILKGNVGNDRLVGSRGADRLTGGLGADLFIYVSVADSTVASNRRDTIYDFSQAEGDKIDLSNIPSNFIGNAEFSHTAGQLRYFAAGRFTFLEGDADGDASADFQIRFTGDYNFTASDFK
jgi:Ca2+-binding RTX toxin-like protein